MKYFVCVLRIGNDNDRLLFLTQASEILNSKSIIWKAEITEIEYNTGKKNLGLSKQIIITDEPK